VAAKEGLPHRVRGSYAFMERLLGSKVGCLGRQREPLLRMPCQAVPGEVSKSGPRRISSLVIVRQTVAEKSVGLGEGESVGRNPASVTCVGGSSEAKTACGLSVRRS